VLLQLARLDLLEHLLAVLVELWWQPVQHLLQQHAQQLPVHALAVARLVQHFGRQLRHTAAEGRLARVVLDFLLAEPEVRQLGMALLVQHHIVRLEVALDDVVLVQVLDGQQDLGDLELGRVLVKLLELVLDLPQVAARALLHDEEQLLASLEGPEELHDEIGGARMLRSVLA